MRRGGGAGASPIETIPQVRRVVVKTPDGDNVDGKFGTAGSFAAYPIFGDVETMVQRRYKIAAAGGRWCRMTYKVVRIRAETRSNALAKRQSHTR